MVWSFRLVSYGTGLNFHKVCDELSSSWITDIGSHGLALRPKVYWFWVSYIEIKVCDKLFSWMPGLDFARLSQPGSPIGTTAMIQCLHLYLHQSNLDLGCPWCYFRWIESYMLNPEALFNLKESQTCRMQDYFISENI